MKILMINVVCGIRSTGRICTDLATALEAKGHDVKIAYGRESVPERFQKYAVKIGNNLDVKLHGLCARLFDSCGWGSKKATDKFVEWIKQYDPDIIHLHNIHGYYINVETLFNYLRTCGKRIIWTLHDCWAFTGHAAYCEAANCEKWKKGCHDCPKKRDYPAAFTDFSKRNWIRKRRVFDGIANMKIVTPSEWLASLVKQSFLSQYEVTVIHNGVDTDTFRPTESDLKDKLGLFDKKIVLGVAALWEERKGILDFFKLTELLSDEYRIVLVGLSKKQINKLPTKIIGIEKTNTVQELVELYSAADVFVNPTYEDNYPTTNLEAIACGTPVITYATGGSPESAVIYGKVVPKGDIQGLYNHITSISRISVGRIETVKVKYTIDNYLMIYSGK